jgi:hypothetical protein
VKNNIAVFVLKIAMKYFFKMHKMMKTGHVLIVWVNVIAQDV